MNKTKNASSKDVAREAGVSQATVSYVLNEVPGIKIKDETRELVLKAAKKLNYHPNLIARSMRLKKSMSIGVVSDKNISNFMFMKALEGIKDALITRNYSITLILNKSYEEDNTEYIKYYSSNRIDGIIFAFAGLTEEHLSLLTEKNIPYVILDSNPKSDYKNLVKTSMNQAIHDAVEHLVRKDIKQIAYFGTGYGNLKDRRFAGYSHALETYELSPDEKIHFKFSGNEDTIEQDLEEYFEKLGSHPQAVFSDSMNLSFHLLRYAAKNSIRIPKDMSVVTVGTSKFWDYTYPSMTAIESPLYEMGYTGSEMLLDIIKSNNEGNLQDSSTSEKDAQEDSNRNDGSQNLADSIVVLEWAFVPRESA